jgi:hypothetical protein
MNKSAFCNCFYGIFLKEVDYNKFLEIGDLSDLKNLPGFKPRTSVGLELVDSLPRTK